MLEYSFYQLERTGDGSGDLPMFSMLRHKSDMLVWSPESVDEQVDSLEWRFGTVKLVAEGGGTRTGSVSVCSTSSDLQRCSAATTSANGTPKTAKSCFYYLVFCVKSHKIVSPAVHLCQRIAMRRSLAESRF